MVEVMISRSFLIDLLYATLYFLTLIRGVCICRLKNDKVIGHNTDIKGFELSIKNLKFNIVDKKILILGAGGVVPSIIFALNKMKVSKIIISNRTKITNC